MTSILCRRSARVLRLGSTSLRATNVKARHRLLWIVTPVVAGLAIGFGLGNASSATTASPTALSGPVGIQPEDVLWGSGGGVDLNLDGRQDFAAPALRGVRGPDAYGSGAFGASRDGGRRVHLGVDYASPPGETVAAPVSGVVARIGRAYAGDGLTFVEIANRQLNYTARVFYVGAIVRPGDRVEAGDAIGASQDLGSRYPGGMTNHVHVELYAAGLQPVDPTSVLPAPVCGGSKC